MASLKGLLKALWFLPVNTAFHRIVKMRSRWAEGKPIRLNDPAIRNVLVIRLDAIGDAVLMSPFLRELRRSLNRNARVTLVTNRVVRQLFEHSPYVDEVLSFDDGIPKLPLPYRRYLRACLFSIRHLRNLRFDVALSPRWDIDYYGAAYLAYFSAARHRIGFSESVSNEKRLANRGYDSFFTQVFRTDGVHEVSRNLDFLAQLGVDSMGQNLEAWLSPADYATAAKFFGSDSPTRRLIALGVGASHPNRVWPMESFRQVASWIVTKHQADVLIVGGPGERQAGDYIQEANPARIHNAAGLTSLRTTAALLSKCSLFIGCDSGPKHLAAACGVPVIEISRFPRGGNCEDAQSPDRFKAWGVKTVILQPEAALPPCKSGCISAHAHCINQITVEDVIQSFSGSEKLGHAN